MARAMVARPARPTRCRGALPGVIAGSIFTISLTLGDCFIPLATANPERCVNQANPQFVEDAWKTQIRRSKDRRNSAIPVC